MAAENLLDGTAEEITSKLIESAKKGQPWAVKAVMDRIAPVRRERRVKLGLPVIRTQEDVAAAIQIVIKAMSDGEISMDEAERALALVDYARKTIESSETANRMKQIEAELKELKEVYGKRAA